MANNTYVALLRAVNVGGAYSLPMPAFVQLLEQIGLDDVRTYIQTGNAVFRTEAEEAAALPGKIKARIKRIHGFAPEVVLFSLDELEQAIAANPYPEADEEPHMLHLTFLASEPRHPDLSVLEGSQKESERFTLEGRVFYLHAPEGVGRSKLFAQIEKALGVVGTARNWRTARGILELAREVAAAGTGRRRRG